MRQNCRWPRMSSSRTAASSGATRACSAASVLSGWTFRRVASQNVDSSSTVLMNTLSNTCFPTG